MHQVTITITQTEQGTVAVSCIPGFDEITPPNLKEFVDAVLGPIREWKQTVKARTTDEHPTINTIGDKPAEKGAVEGGSK